MPYKDPEAKRRYMTRYYREKIKTGEIPSTAHRKRSYGLTSSYTNKTRAFESPVLSVKSSNSRPITPLHAQPASTRTGLNPAFVSKREKKPERSERDTKNAFPKDLQVWGMVL